MVSYLWELDQRAARNRLYPLAIGLLGVFIFGYWCTNPPNIPALVPDSSSYLDFQAFRSAGYPLFLDAIRLLDRELIGIHYYQLGLLIGSLCILGYSVRCFSGTAMAGVALVVGTGLHPQYIRYCFTILSEPLFFASLNLFIAIQLRRNFDTKLYWGATGAMLAWLILIKAVAWALICVPAAILLNQIFRQTKLTTNPVFKNIVFLLAGFAIVTSAGMIHRYANHGTVKAESFLGNQLIGKMSLTAINPAETDYPKSVDLWQQEMAPLMQAREDSFSDNWDLQFLFSLNYYDYLRFVRAEEMLEATDSNLKRPEFQSLLASQLLSLAPTAYLNDVAISFYALWTQGELQTQAFSRQYNTKIDALPESLKTAWPPYYLSEARQTAAYIIKPFLYLSFFINALCLIYGLCNWLRKKTIPEKVMPLFVVCLAVQAYYLLVALLQAALVRYMIPMWPLLLLSAVLSTLLLLEKVHPDLER